MRDPIACSCHVTHGSQLFWGVPGDVGAAQGALWVSWLMVWPLKWFKPSSKRSFRTYGVTGQVIFLSVLICKLAVACRVCCED